MMFETASILKGITIILYEQTKTGTNRMGEDVYTESPVEIENVLVNPTSDEERLESLNLTGRRAIYTLAIPKGDTHDWVGKKVEFFGQTFQTIGQPTEGIESLIPLNWNKHVKVAMYGERED